MNTTSFSTNSLLIAALVATSPIVGAEERKIDMRDPANHVFDKVLMPWDIHHADPELGVGI